jgi:transcriptional regulator with PAS, ATPase and Fis domain
MARSVRRLRSSASNEPQEKRITEGAFREDIYYRLNVIPASLPPLRERRDDVLLLADHFPRSRRLFQITRHTREIFCTYDWFSLAAL